MSRGLHGICSKTGVTLGVGEKLCVRRDFCVNWSISVPAETSGPRALKRSLKEGTVGDCRARNTGYAKGKTEVVVKRTGFWEAEKRGILLRRIRDANSFRWVTGLL